MLDFQIACNVGMDSNTDAAELNHEIGTLIDENTKH